MMRHLEVLKAEIQAKKLRTTIAPQVTPDQAGLRYQYTPTLAPRRVTLSRDCVMDEGASALSPDDVYATVPQGSVGFRGFHAPLNRHQGVSSPLVMSPRVAGQFGAPSPLSSPRSSASYIGTSPYPSPSMRMNWRHDSECSDSSVSSWPSTRSDRHLDMYKRSSSYDIDMDQFHHQPRRRHAEAAFGSESALLEHTAIKKEAGEEQAGPAGVRRAHSSASQGKADDSGPSKAAKGSSSAAGDEVELCLICGDRASGYHYNALSCEGCKGFFRRSVTRQAEYTCKYGGRCEMDMWMRRRCQACRLRRCRDVGMREECLLSERQCSARNARRNQRKLSAEKSAAGQPKQLGKQQLAQQQQLGKQQIAQQQQLGKQQLAQQQLSQQLQKQNKQHQQQKEQTQQMSAATHLPSPQQREHSLSSSPMICQSSNQTTPPPLFTMSGRSVRSGRIIDEDEEMSECCNEPLEKILEKLSEEHRSVVKCLLAYQDRFELPSEADLAKLSEMKVNEEQEPVDMADAIFVHMVEMTILVTRLVINFAKSLPGFSSLAKEDQIILLKGSASEVMMLRTSRRYDPQTDTVVFGNGTPFSANAMDFGGLQGHINSMFEFSRGMSRLLVDNAEYALLTALTIFSVRPGLKDVLAVEQIQDIYVEVLLAYLCERRSGSRTYLAKLLMKLVELRSLSAEHSEVLRNLKVEKKSLPPLLTEYFDVSD